MATITDTPTTPRPDAAAWSTLADAFFLKDDARGGACIGIGAFLSAWDGMTTRTAADGLTDGGYAVTYQTVNHAATAYALARTASRYRGVVVLPDDATPQDAARAALTDDAAATLPVLWSLTDALGVNGVKAVLLDAADDDGAAYDAERAARVLKDAADALASFRARTKSAQKGGGGLKKADAVASVLADYAAEYAAAQKKKKDDADKKKADADKKKKDDAQKANGTAPLLWSDGAAWGAFCGILTDAAAAAGRAATADGAAYAAALAPWQTVAADAVAVLSAALAAADAAAAQKAADALAAERAADAADKKAADDAAAALLADAVANAADGRGGAVADALKDAAQKKGAAPRRRPAAQKAAPRQKAAA